MIAANLCHRNGAARQVWLSEQKRAQRAIALFAQVAQFTGQAGKRQEAARKYPGFTPATQDHLADQRQRRAFHPQWLAFIQTGYTNNLPDDIDPEIPLT